MSEEKSEKIVDQREPWEKKPEFNFGLVVLISLGFFSTSIWSFYDNQAPLVLENLFGNFFLIGFIMTVDNIAGVFIQPLTGALSDRMKSKYGRRMPFVMVGLPISATAFFCLGLTKNSPVLYILNILWFVTSMSIWRAPIVSLMPDFVHPKDRSKGNAIVNVLGGIGTTIISMVGGIVLKVNYALAFGILSIVMIIAFVILFIGVKEPDTREWDFSTGKDEKKKNKTSFKENLEYIWNEEDKSMVWMMLAIFAWFITYNTSASFISLYARNFYNFADGDAAFLVTITAVSFLVFAYFAVKLSQKLGRKKTIMIGLIVWAIGFIIGSISVSPSTQYLLYITTILMGCGWSLININSIAMVWSMAPDIKSIGVYTGLYYTASFSSQIVGPLTFGFIFEYGIGLRYMFLILMLLLIVAFFAMSKVSRGEVELTEEEKEKRKNAIEELKSDD